ncbi:hypothetical protein Tco_1127706 [Tanacetum coccineum]
MNNNDDGVYEEHDVDEDDLEEDSERELDAMIETLDPNQDEEVALGIESVRKRYRILKQIREPTANEPKKEVEHGDEEDNSRGENENYLDNSDVESLHEDVSKDGTVELRRTPVRFPRYKENSGAVSFSIGLSFTDHQQFKKALLKYAVQEKKDYKFVRNASSPYMEIGFPLLLTITRKCGERVCFLTAVGQDPNNQYAPVSNWQLWRPESESTSEHRLCARHIYANWYSDFHGEKLKVAFYSVDKCANEAQMQQRLDVIKAPINRPPRLIFATLDEIDNIKDGANRSLENKDIKQWCRAFFKSASKCDSVDNNSTEAWNFVLIGARSKPIISMNESIREYLMERMIQKVKFASKWRLDCGPNIRDIMNENSSVSCKWKVKWNGDEGRGAWELSDIPCCHAIAAIKSRAKDPYDYVDKCYSKEKYLAAYGHPIEVVGSEEFWPHIRGGELLPPLPKAMPGRPKKARRRRKYEPKKLKTKLSRHRRDMHCENCKSSTHTKRTCTVSLDSADNTT